MNERRDPTVSRKNTFLQRWVSLNMWIFPVVLIVRALFDAFFERILEPGFNSVSTPALDFARIVASTVEGVILGIGVGWFQWHCLKRYFPLRLTWFWLTLAGFVSAFCIILGPLETIILSSEIVTQLNFSPVKIHTTLSLLSGLTGLWIGGFQMLVLRKHIKHYWIWSICSGLGLGIGIFLSYGLPRILVIFAPIDNPDNPYYWIQIMLLFPVTIFAYFLPALCYGYCTGWLLKINLSKWSELHK
ncbi:MAG: hypothetical protein ACPGVO_07945 [Spirulinaceae cyanobacterium]